LSKFQESSIQVEGCFGSTKAEVERLDFDALAERGFATGGSGNSVLICDVAKGMSTRVLRTTSEARSEVGKRRPSRPTESAVAAGMTLTARALSFLTSTSRGTAACWMGLLLSAATEAAGGRHLAFVCGAGFAAARLATPGGRIPEPVHTMP
jgi:hypothetical protein